MGNASHEFWGRQKGLFTILITLLWVGLCQLPIGAYFANTNKEIICIVGDGSFMMSLQELATVMHHQIKLKLIIINNNGYSMIKQTQEQWLNSKYVASSKAGGISFPEYENVAQTFDLEYFLFRNMKTDEKILNSFLSIKKASLTRSGNFTRG